MESLLFFGGLIFVMVLIVVCIKLVNQKPKSKNTAIIRNLPRRGIL